MASSTPATYWQTEESRKWSKNGKTSILVIAVVSTVRTTRCSRSASQTCQVKPWWNYTALNVTMFTHQSLQGITIQTAVISEPDSRICFSWFTPNTDRRNRSKVSCRNCTDSKYISWLTIYSGRQVKIRRVFNIKYGTREVDIQCIQNIVSSLSKFALFGHFQNNFSPNAFRKYKISKLPD